MPAAFPLPLGSGWELRPLGISLQVPALLLTALICGPRSSVLAAVAYLSIGLFQLPVFQDGGGMGYLLDPAFGYLAGFIPAAWLCGKLGRQSGTDDPMALSGIAVLGLLVMHACGLVNLLLGGLLGRWGGDLLPLLLSYTLALLPQLLLCCAVGLVAWPLRRLLLLES